MKFLAQSIIVICLWGCYGKQPPMVKTGNEGKLMPVIDLKLIDSNTYFSTQNIPKGKPSILFAFEPWCPYCKAQIKSVISNIESFKDINLYFLTNSNYPEFKSFYERFHFEKYPSITIGIDTNHTFSQYFKTSQVPYWAIYDQNRKLKQVVIGKNYVSTIKKIALN